MNKETKLKAAGIFKSMPDQKVLFVNKKCEFFTRESLARASVASSKDYDKIDRFGSEENSNSLASVKSEEITLEVLKSKGAQLEGYLNDMSRAALNDLDSLIVGNVTASQNKPSAVKLIVEAVNAAATAE